MIMRQGDNDYNHDKAFGQYGGEMVRQYVSCTVYHHLLGML